MSVASQPASVAGPPPTVQERERRDANVGHLQGLNRCVALKPEDLKLKPLNPH